MGVLGLWQLLEPSSRPTKLQALEGKKLGIDISIWLYQATKGARTPNGHIIVLYNRICKLLHFKVKPIFVFDGPNVPKLKERVLKERQRKRNEAAAKTKDIDEKIKSNLLESYVLKSLVGDVDSNALLAKIKATSVIDKARENAEEDIFKLPENSNFKSREDSNDDEDVIEVDEAYSSHIDINKIDKDVLESMPHEIQYELLANYKESLKKRKDNVESFPEESNEFSTFQMKALLHKSDISKKIENLKNTMKSQYAMNDFDDVFHKKIASQDTGEVILFTRKSRTNFNQEVLEELKNELINEEMIEKLSNENNSEDLSQKKAETRIEFNSYNNKIEIVPVKNNGSKSIQPAGVVNREIIEIKNDAENKDVIAEDDFTSILDPSPEDLDVQRQILDQIKSSQTFKKQILDEQEVHRHLLNHEIQPKKSIIETMLVEDEESDSDEDFVEVIDNAVQNSTVNKEIRPNESIIETMLVEDEESDSDEDFVEVIDTAIPNSSVNKDTLNKEAVQDVQSVDDEELPSNPSATKATTSKQIDTVDQGDIDTELFDNYSSNLVKEREDFLQERQNTERLSHGIESYIIDDAKYLLQLFGVPYVVSPGEAEAQCAYLDEQGFTDGSITDDSDVWLFGAKRVYKNFFGSGQFIDSYSDIVIKSQLGLNRESLINVALLVGSDYTEGVENVGIVKAIEILQEFEGNGLEVLKNFKKWHDDAQSIPGQKFNKLRTVLSKLKLPNNFPSELVANAYLNPAIDRNEEEFSWSLPNLDLIRKFCTSKLSWSVTKIDNDILPIIRRLNETTVQASIENFFQYETTSSFSKQSKRMKTAINSFKRKNNAQTSAAAKCDDLNLSSDENETTKKVAPGRSEKERSSIRITKRKK